MPNWPARVEEIRAISNSGSNLLWLTQELLLQRMEEQSLMLKGPPNKAGVKFPIMISRPIKRCYSHQGRSRCREKNWRYREKSRLPEQALWRSGDMSQPRESVD